MGLFGRKKKKAAEKKRQEELVRQAKIAEENRIKQEKKLKKETKEKKLREKAKKLVKPKITEKKKTTKPKQSSKTTTKPKSKKGPSGKYEVYQEAGLYKYRLKASNGEILVVSFGYSSRKGAKNGIETFMNAVEGNTFEIITDKAGFSHFDLFDARKARVIVIGEFYKTLKLAESAVESVRKFYDIDKVFDLKDIPTKEIREEKVEKIKIVENSSGKFQLVKDKKFYLIKLLASNGQVLLVSQQYASKQTAIKGLDVIKKAIEARSFTISKDKQNRYQYNLYSQNKQLIVSGETYPVKNNCISSISSVCKFAGKAELVEVK